MSVVAILLASLATASAPPPGAYEADLRRALAECGVSREAVTVVEDDTLQGYVVTIAGEDGAFTEAAMACISSVSFKFLEFYEFSTPELNARFRAASDASPEMLALKRQARQEAWDWLAERGLLAGSPKLQQQSLAEFLREVEVFSGYAPGSLLVARGRWIIFQPPQGEPDFSPAFVERWNRLWNVLKVGLPEDSGTETLFAVEREPVD